jgi:hypothetical protein
MVVYTNYLKKESKTMKRKILLGLLSLAVVVFLKMSVYAVDNQVYTNYGTYYDVNTSSNMVVTVSTSTVYTLTAVGEGVQRIIYTSGSEDVYQSKSSTNNVTTDGILLNPGTTYIEDRYFGDMYFQSTVGDSEIRVETIRQSTY